MSEPILVSGIIDFDPAKRDEAIAAVTTLMVATRAEEGCVEYAFTGDLNDPGRLWLWEHWESAEANAVHAAAPHLAEFLTAAGGLGITRATLTRWTGATGAPI